MQKRSPLSPFPTGWFQVAYSDELASGALASVHYFGRALALFRGQDGKAAMLDAHCAESGANLAVEGRVDANTVVCPCHGWCYDGSGACVRVPNGGAIPPRARLRAWPVVERNGLIMVWHQAEGKGPEWQIPGLAEYASEAWTAYDKRRWQIRVHVQAMAESSVDREHSATTTGRPAPQPPEVQVDGPRLRSVTRARLQTLGGEVDITLDTRLWGLGFTTVRFGGGADGLLVGSATPIDGETVDVRFAFSVRKLRNAAETVGAGAAIIQDVERRMIEDVLIWENEGDREEPALDSGTDPVAIFRRWSEQFYGPLSGSPDPEAGL